MLARVIQVGVVKARTVIGHTPDVKNLVEDLGEFQPTFVLAVPRVFEKVFNGAKAKAEADGKGKIFDRAAQVAIDWSRAQDTGGPGIALRAQHALFDKLVYGKLRAALGGRCLGRDLRRRAAGRPARPLLPRHRRDGLRGLRPDRDHRRGVGEPRRRHCGSAPSAARCPASQSAIADDGEILIRGGIVLRGYWNNEEATAEAIDADGWFHTGDLGELDDDGYLRITGRKKEIIVTAGGKNVAPAVLEDRHPGPPAGQPVHGRRRPAAVHRRADHPRRGGAARRGWSRKGKPTDARPEQLRDDPELLAELHAAVDGGQQGGVQGRGDQEVPRARRPTSPRTTGCSRRA